MGDKGLSGKHIAKGAKRAKLAVRFVLEKLLFELAGENLAEAEKAHDKEQRMKHCAAAIVFAHITVEAYFNGFLEDRMLWDPSPVGKWLREAVAKSGDSPARRRLIAESLGVLDSQTLEPLSDDLKARSGDLNSLRNYLVHYGGRFVPVENLRRKQGVTVTKEEEKLKVEEARKAVDTARELILDLHRREGTDPPEWIRPTSRPQGK